MGEFNLPNCEVSVDGARNTYKDDMQGYLIITVVASESPRPQFLNQGSVLLLRFVECWSGIRV